VSPTVLFGEKNFAEFGLLSGVVILLDHEKNCSQVELMSVLLIEL
jgi:hypothetical protein